MVQTTSSVTKISISRHEWSIVVLVALITATLLLLPYLLGHWLAPEGTVFTGLFFNVEDGSYLSILQQGRAGQWHYQNYFTVETHRPVFIQGFYLALGHLARLLGITAVAMWHLSRWLFNFLLFLLLYPFIAIFITIPGHRFTAYALAIFGSGFDWWQLPPGLERAGTLEAVPVDLFMPEAHIFSSALTYPHFIAGITLMMLIFWWMMVALAGDGRLFPPWRYAVAAGFANLLLGLVYPFLIFLIAAVLGLYFLLRLWADRRLRWRDVGLLAILFVIPAPLFLYYGWAISNVELLRVWNAQAVTLTPSPVHVLLAYLPYLLFGSLAWRRWRKWSSDRRTAVSFLWIWVLAVAILLYLPLNPQRRFVEGVQIPLAILAAIGLYEVALPWIMARRLLQRLLQRPRYSAGGMRRLLVILVCLLVSVLNLYLYAGTAVTLTVIQPYPLFRPVEEVAAMSWIREETAPSAVVLGSYWTGSYLPAAAQRSVFVGHLYETVAFETRQELAQQFFAVETADSWRRSLLREHGIDYLFYGRSERELGAWQPENQPYLELVFQKRETAVYRVVPPF